MESNTELSTLNSFPIDVREAFQEFISAPNYINRERIEYTKWQQLHIYLDNTQLKPKTASEIRLKHRALTEFSLIANRLYRRPDIKFETPRYVVPEREAFDIIAGEHLRLLHTGIKKTWHGIQKKYYGIKREEVAFVIKRCKNYALNRPEAIKAPLVPIISERA